METENPRSFEATGSSRRTMLTRAAGAAAIAGAGAVGLHARASAQATPGPSGCEPALGSAASFFSVEGVEIAKLTVSKVTDPFTGYNPSYPPPRGSRFVLLSVTVENTGPNPFSFDPGRVIIQDDQGFVIYATGVNLGDQPVEPGLGGQDVPPASSVSGVIGYVLVKGVTAQRAFFTPSSDRLVLLANLG